MKSLIIGHINYINVIPVDVELLKPEYKSSKVLGVPAILNRELLNGCVDIGFFSSIFYLRNKEKLDIAGPYCIASKKEAMSVIIGSNFNLEKRKKDTLLIFETPASETSIFLSRVILKDYFGFELVSTSREKADAEVLIGDEALLKNYKKTFSYIYDVGKLWNEMTGLPAVFAVLTTRSQVKVEKRNELEQYLKDLEETLSYFEANVDEVVKLARKRLDLPEDYLERYYLGLHYRLGKEEMDSITKMGEYLKNEEKYRVEQDKR